MLTSHNLRADNEPSVASFEHSNGFVWIYSTVEGLIQQVTMRHLERRPSALTRFKRWKIGQLATALYCRHMICAELEFNVEHNFAPVAIDMVFYDVGDLLKRAR